MSSNKSSVFGLTPEATSLVKLGSAQFALVATGLLTVFIVVWIVLMPWTYDEFIREVALKPYEEQFGFKTGPVEWRGAGGDVHTVWGIVFVTADGALERAGVRPGDIPLDYHGGAGALYSALHRAAAGEIVSFEVINAEDALSQSARRVITLLPAR